MPLQGSERPGCITAICLFLAFAVFGWTLLAVIDPGNRGSWYPAHLVVQAMAAGGALVGLWRMQKWGVIVCGSLAALVHVLYLFIGLLNVETFFIYAITLGPALHFYRRMQ